MLKTYDEWFESALQIDLGAKEKGYLKLEQT